tara:strand:- start:268 stop:717 length:450 start_codon:yes stop_codon:yes gene_type:complete
MGRRKKKDDAGMDLSSFLNIMTATIGVQTLTLVIFALQIKPGVKAVQILPAGGEGKGKSGNYVLCEKNGELDMLIRNEELKLNINDDKLNRIIEDLGSDEQPQYIVIGVRPEGYPCFEKLRSKIEFNKLEYGYEPIESDLKVQFPKNKK